MSDQPPQNPRLQRIVFALGVILPCVLFVAAMVVWWTSGGQPVGGRPLWSGLSMVAGVGLIVALYLLADRYWIRRED